MDLAEGDDLRIMATHFRDAENVTVFAGDFSWLLTDRQIRDIVIGLNEDAKVTLVSSRNEGEVEKELNRSEPTRQLLASLKESRRIQFNSKLAIKLSLIKSNERYRILYRFESTELSSSKYKMCIVTDTDATHRLLDAISKIVRKNYGR